MSEIHCAQHKTNFRFGFNIFHWRPKKQDWNVPYKQEGNMVLWKASVKIRWLQLPWALGACLPSSSKKKNKLIFTLSTYLCHILPTYVLLRHLNLSTNLNYFLILISFFILLKVPSPVPKSLDCRILMGLGSCSSHHSQSRFSHWPSLWKGITDLHLTTVIEWGSMETSADFDGLW